MAGAAGAGGAPAAPIAVPARAGRGADCAGRCGRRQPDRAPPSRAAMDRRPSASSSAASDAAQLRRAGLRRQARTRRSGPRRTARCRRPAAAAGRAPDLGRPSGARAPASRPGEGHRPARPGRAGGAARPAGPRASGLAVPMSMPRYTWRESATRISTGSRSATASASSVLPLAVGPTMAPIGGVIGPVAQTSIRRCTCSIAVARPLARSMADHHRVQAHRPVGHVEAGRQVAEEARQHRLQAEADDRVARSGHADVADVGGPLRQQPGIGGWHVGMGADHRTDTAVQVPAHGVLLRRDLAVEVEDAHRRQRLGGAVEQRVHGGERRVELVHEDAAHGVDDCHPLAVRQLVDQPAAAGRVVRDS